jgi:hypothetical protein
LWLLCQFSTCGCKSSQGLYDEWYSLLPYLIECEQVASLPFILVGINDQLSEVDALLEKALIASGFAD